MVTLHSRKLGTILPSCTARSISASRSDDRWLAEDHRAPEEGAPSWGVQSAPDFFSCLRRLQSGAHAKYHGCNSDRVSRCRSVLRATNFDPEAAKIPSNTLSESIIDEK